MDSLRSIHARVAALSRFRSPNDPELNATREELARCLEENRALRTRISSLPPGLCAQVLPAKEEARSRV
jgi:hypothetical protein